MDKRVGRQLLGKRGELLTCGELLRRGVVPYQPLVDVEAVDYVVRRPGGDYLELQVKTINTPKDPMWFQATNVPDRDDYFLVLISAPLDWATWIVPARVFIQYASGPSGPNRNIYDLNLATAGRESALARYKDNWELIVTKAAEETAP